MTAGRLANVRLAEAAGAEGERNRRACDRNVQARVSRPPDLRERAASAVGAERVRRALQPRATAPVARAVGSRRPATTISARERGPHRWPADPRWVASRVRGSRGVTSGRTTFSGSTGASRRPARFRDLRFASRRVSDASQSGDAMPLYEARENNGPDHRSRDRRRRRAHPRRSRRGRGAAAPGRPLAAAAHARGSLATRRGAGRGRYSRLSTLASQRDSAADRRASTIRTIASVSRRQYTSRSARSCSRRPDDVSSLSVSRNASVASVPSWTARSS